MLAKADPIILVKVYSLPVDWTKFEAFADSKLNVAEIMIPVSDRVENIVGNFQTGPNSKHLQMTM